MKFGLTKAQYDFIKQTVVTPLAQQGVKVWCFGSRATGTQKKFSDLDLLIDGPDNLNLGDIEEELIQSNFPYKVDLVLRQHLAESYKAHVDKTKVAFCQEST